MEDSFVCVSCNTFSKEEGTKPIEELFNSKENKQDWLCNSCGATVVSEDWYNGLKET